VEPCSLVAFDTRLLEPGIFSLMGRDPDPTLHITSWIFEFVRSSMFCEETGQDGEGLEAMGAFDVRPEPRHAQTMQTSYTSEWRNPSIESILQLQVEGGINPHVFSRP
jgi:hypothetical protein